MTHATTAHPRPRAALWAGRTLGALVVLFLALDATMKLVPLPIVLESMVELGYPPSEGLARGLGVLLIACTLLYAFPRTAMLGAILLTGYLGGAVATHLRVGSTVASHLLFGVYVGLTAWGGLYLREPRLAALIPLRRPAREGDGR